MTITVYYGEKTNKPVLEPTNVYKQFFKDQHQKYNMNGIHHCPALKEYFSNTFSIKNIHYWTLVRDKDEYYSDTLDTDAFERYLFSRNKETGFFSMSLPEICVIPDKSVNVELIQPSLSSCDINLKTVITPGKFNPYNHIRPLELPFYFKERNDKITCKKNDDLYYIRFCTNEKIVFKRFICNDYFNNIFEENLKSREFNKISLPLKWWYEKNKLVKVRQRAMDHIKSNLCD